MKRGLAIVLILLIAALAGAAWLARRDRAQQGGELTVYCAAGLKKPVEEIAAAYQRETGTVVRLQYGGTGTVLSAIRVSKQGDLFLPTDNVGVEDARKFDAIAEVIPLVKQHPVIAVRSGNPLGIRAFSDLSRDGVRFALTNPDPKNLTAASKADWNHISHGHSHPVAASDYRTVRCLTMSVDHHTAF